MTEITAGKPERFHLCQKCAMQATGDTSPTKASAHKPPNCSFCGKGSHEVGIMIEGSDNIYIYCRKYAKQARHKSTTCSFCSKSSQEVGEMVEGPNKIYICSACTELANIIFQQEQSMK